MTDKFELKISPINEIDDQEWNNFLLSASEATYFCTTDHWQSFNDAFILQIKNGTNEIIAGIPFRTQSVIPWIGRFFKFCRIDSTVIVSQTLSKSETYYYKKLILESLIKFIKDSKVVFLYISPMTRSHDSSLLKEMGFRDAKCATFIIDLTKDENDIFKSFSKGNRSSIHAANKKGVKTKIFEGKAALTNVSEFCTLQDKLFDHKRDSYSRTSYKSESFLKSIFSSKYSKTYLAMAYYNKQPAAAAILISYNKLIYYYLGASDFILTKDSNASNLLHFEIIKFAKNLGLIKYDLGGIPFSSDPSIQAYGVYKFKKSFGGERFEYDNGNFIIRKYRYWIIWKLQMNQSHPIIQFFYKLLKGNNYS